MNGFVSPSSAAVLNWVGGDFALLSHPGDILVVDNCGWVGATGIQCVETRNAAKHPTMHGIAPARKNDSTQNVISAEAEKFYSSECPDCFPWLFDSLWDSTLQIIGDFFLANWI